MKKQVFAYLHTHWDREWYRNKEDFNLRLLSVFDIILDELKQNKAPFFYFDGQVIALLDYLKFRKDKKEEIADLIKKKKLAVGPYFVSADSYLVNFISMLKNLELGMKISNEFHQKEFIGYMADIFGVSGAVFDALKLKNIDKALIWRGVNPLKISNNCNFIKNNIKTTWLSRGYFNDFFHADEPDAALIEDNLDKIAKYSPSSLLLPIGGDHLGILRDADNVVRKINKKLKNYEIILTSPFEYFKKTEFKNITKEDEFLDNSETYILQGVYSARIAQKIKNCKIQNELSRIIEPLNFYFGGKYDENIEFIYKTLIKNHAHDGIYGCSLDSVNKAVDARFDKCINAADALLRRLVGDIRQKYNIYGKSTGKIGLFNLSNCHNLKTIKLKAPYILPFAQVIDKEQGFCEELLYDIYKIPVTEDITPIYTQLVEVSSNKRFEFNTVKIKKPRKIVQVTQNSIENENIKLSVKNNKIIILNKKTNKKFNLKLTDIKDTGDSYNFAPCGEYKTLNPIKTKVNYDGEISSCLKIYFKDIELDVELRNHQEFLKFTSVINNKTKDHKIQLCLLLEGNISQTVSQEANGIIRRKIDYNYKMQDCMPALRPYELKTNSYPMQNFVCAQDTVVLTKGLYEYEIYKNELRICLLRCTSTISNPKNPARAIPAGPDLKIQDAQCPGKNEAEFALLFGDYKKAYSAIDVFLENYVAIDGEIREDINIKTDEFPKEFYFLGISENKKIGYNISQNKIIVI